jgi:Ras-related protein Rab-5C
MYYRNANCAVVLYDITSSATLEKARTWIRELQRQADPSIVIALCGNKSDLAARRQVTEEEAKKYAEEEGLMWAETSAKTGEGVSEIFTAIGAFAFLGRTPLVINIHPRSCSQETPVDCATCIVACRRSSRRRSGRRSRSQQAGNSAAGPRGVQLLGVCSTYISLTSI